MTRKYHNHILQTNLRHHDEGTQNTDSHNTITINNQLSLAQQVDCTARKDTSNLITQRKTPTLKSPG